MKKITLFLIIAGITAAFFSCSKEKESERFTLLTAHIWTSDSLLVNGVDAGGPGGMLEKFKGDAKFEKDGTGYFGKYKGTWRFAYGEENLVIESDSLQVPLTAKIVLLTTTDLKITTVYPNLANPQNPFNIRMTFKPKQ
ncbi:MAG TPA: hypothetical protein P5320_03450 [Bacteroidales bacterium]|nr:hypothetical protein [Bacteroidales bacterium]HOK74306.1 hypothetical protein [Bacteroidales bacterium]HOM40151.1 hypothetical protein [Bacteroidales bacterium]HPP92431.1 hypothetical protein [Bacteroidales bacterium]HRR15755.1 hypothetical protein [Bacteroidales bacterium]